MSNIPKNLIFGGAPQPFLAPKKTQDKTQKTQDRQSIFYLCKFTPPVLFAFHSTFDEGALELIIRNSDGLLRQCKNIVLGSLIQASVESKKVINSDIVNSILIQPHWKKPEELAKL